MLTRLGVTNSFTKSYYVKLDSWTGEHDYKPVWYIDLDKELFWRGTTRAGVAAGMITGTLVTLVWKSTPALSGLVYELIPAFGLSFVITVLVSHFTHRPAAIEEMFAAMQETGR